MTKTTELARIELLQYKRQCKETSKAKIEFEQAESRLLATTVRTSGAVRTRGGHGGANYKIENAIDHAQNKKIKFLEKLLSETALWCFLFGRIEPLKNFIILNDFFLEGKSKEKIAEENELTIRQVNRQINSGLLEYSQKYFCVERATTEKSNAVNLTKPDNKKIYVYTGTTAVDYSSAIDELLKKTLCFISGKCLLSVYAFMRRLCAVRRRCKGLASEILYVAICFLEKRYLYDVDLPDKDFTAVEIFLTSEDVAISKTKMQNIISTIIDKRPQLSNGAYHDTILTVEPIRNGHGGYCIHYVTE